MRCKGGCGMISAAQGGQEDDVIQKGRSFTELPGT